MSRIGFAALLMAVATAAPGCKQDEKPRPDPDAQECCRRSYQARLHETDVQAGTATLFVTVYQYRWFGRPDNPKGGVFRAETRDAPAAGAAFDVGFAPDKPGSGMTPVAVRAVTGDKGLLVVKVPAEVIGYARHGSGMVVSLRPDLRAADPWVQTKPQVAFPDGPVTVGFQTLSDMLLNSGR